MNAAAFERRYQAALRRKRAWQAAALALFAALLTLSALSTEFTPARLIEGLPKTAGFFERAAPDLQAAHLFDGEKQQGSLLYWFYRWDLWLALLFESLQMAVLATILGGTAALLGAFAAAANTTPHPALGFALRRVFELFRTLPDIVLALVFVFAFGIGPMAGVLAIAIHTTGALGKLTTEVIENIDMKPVDGVRASGGSWAQAMRYGAAPQILPNFASYGLLRFEINVAGAAAVGLVGAGGIGQEFIAAINFGFFQDASAILVMIIAVIMMIDLTSEAIRHRFLAATVPA